MRRVAAAAVAVLVLAGMTGCGIPGATDVQVHGEKPAPDPPGGANTIAPVDRASGTTGSPETLLASFLSAAAGDPEHAVERARSFLAPTQSANWKPSSEINIVRFVEAPLYTTTESSTTVVLKVQHLGVLSANGSVEPPNNEETEYTLTVGEVAGQNGFWVLSAPPLLLLPDTELDERYVSTPVYFWNKEQTALVPDPRWLSRSVSSERRPTELLEWLGSGPSALIGQAVDGLPANAKQKGNVPKPAPGGPLEVNLSAEAGALDEEAIRRLGAQLFWTLRDYAGGGLQIKVEGQSRATFTGDTTVLSANPSSALPAEPDRFAVYDGQIVRMRGTNQVPAPVPLVTAETNTGVSLASFSRFGTRTLGAWIRERGDGSELVVGAGTELLQIPLPGPAGRPAWLWAPAVTADAHPEDLVGLVLVDGRLQQFGTQHTNLTPIAVSNLPGPITAMAVSYDGQRIALVSGGRVYVTALIRTDTSVKASTTIREIPTSLRNVTAVDFAAENQLIVAGLRPKGNRIGLAEVSVDGVLEQERAAEPGSAQVTYLAAYPVNPIGANSGGSEAAYVANNIAYSLLSTSTRILPPQLVQPPPDAATNEIAAPFFLE